MTRVNPNNDFEINFSDTEKHGFSKCELLRRKHYINTTPPVHFNKLTELQKQRVRNEASRVFIKHEPTKWWNIFNCTKKIKSSERKNINLCVFEIINYISLYAHNIVHIFRADNKDKDIQNYVEALSKNEKIDYKAIRPEKLCTILKLYILNHLNGILSIDIASMLCSSFKKRSKLEYKALMAYLPYALSENEASLLIRIFNLFKIIDKNKDKTKMSIDSLLSLFSLVMFPKETFQAFDDLNIVKSIAQDIYCLDFNEIPFTMAVVSNQGPMGPFGPHGRFFWAPPNS